jgi:endoglucanase
VMAPHPSPGIPLTVVTESKAAEAAGSASAGSAEAAAAGYLAAQPTAVWLTPEQEPIGTVGARIGELAAQSRTQESTLVIVVYGLPERDCGNYSAGGLAPAEYEIWTTEIGDALRAADDVRAIVIVEPDSLALAPECGNVSERVIQLRAAVADLSGPSTWLYVDGGHSNWLPATQMADLIRQVDDGSRIRGFATNTSNYNDLVAEFAYAHELSALLDGLHAVVDSGRSGAGSDGQWCNPAGRLVGDDPGTSRRKRRSVQRRPGGGCMVARRCDRADEGAHRMRGGTSAPRRRGDVAQFPQCASPRAAALPPPRTPHDAP